MMLQNFTTTEISKYPAHVDEPNVVETALNIYEGELNPGFFRYPAGHMNMLALIFKICSIFKYDIKKENSYKIAWFLERIGQKLEFWENVKAGTQDPFEKMQWGEGVKGAGQHDSISSNNKKISDEETLTL